MLSNVTALPFFADASHVKNQRVAQALEVVPDDAPVCIVWIQDGKLYRISAATVQELVWMFEASKGEVMYE